MATQKDVAKDKFKQRMYDKSQPRISQQKKAFLGWVNAHLQQRSMRIDNLEDISQISPLIYLLEILEKKPLNKITKYHKEPRNTYDKIEGMKMCLQCIKIRDDSNANPFDPKSLVSGKDIKVYLALIWRIIVIYAIKQETSSIEEKKNENEQNNEKKSPEQCLREWVNKRLSNELQINNFTNEWSDGKVLICLMNQALAQNNQIKIENVENIKQKELLTTILQLNAKHLHIPQLLDPNDLVSSPNKEAVMTYVLLLKSVIESKDATNQPIYTHKVLTIKCCIESTIEFNIRIPSGDDWDKKLKSLLSKIPKKIKYLANMDKSLWSIQINGKVVSKENSEELKQILNNIPPIAAIQVVKTVENVSTAEGSENDYIVSVHCGDQELNYKLPNAKSSWNDDMYGELQKVIVTTFNLKSEFELIDVDNVAIDDIDDLLGIFDDEDFQNKTTHLFVKNETRSGNMNKFVIACNGKSFEWIPPNANSDDQKEWQTNWNLLLNEINSQYNININEIELQQDEDGTQIDVHCDDLQEIWEDLVDNDDNYVAEIKIVSVQPGISHIASNVINDVEGDIVPDEPGSSLTTSMSNEFKSWFDDVLKLPQYYQLFIDAGYTDFDYFDTDFNEDELINDIGVNKKVHRKRILIEIKKLTKGDHESVEKTQLRAWFHDTIKLPKYFDICFNYGYEQLSYFTTDITDSDLKDAGIKIKPHRTKILNEIKKLPHNKTQLQIPSKVHLLTESKTVFESSEEEQDDETIIDDQKNEIHFKLSKLGSLMGSLEATKQKLCFETINSIKENVASFNETRGGPMEDVQSREEKKMEIEEEKEEEEEENFTADINFQEMVAKISIKETAKFIQCVVEFLKILGYSVSWDEKNSKWLIEGKASNDILEDVSLNFRHLIDAMQKPHKTIYEELDINILTETAVCKHKSGVYDDAFIIFQLPQILLENQQLSLVNKTVLDPGNMERFINFLAPNSSKDLCKEIYFDKLKKLKVSSIGLFGSREEVLSMLISYHAISKPLYDKLIHDSKDECLLPGIHAILPINIHKNVNAFKEWNKIIYLFYWSLPNTFDLVKMKSVKYMRKDPACLLSRVLYEISTTVCIEVSSKELTDFGVIKRPKYEIEEAADDKPSIIQFVIEETKENHIVCEQKETNIETLNASSKIHNNVANDMCLLNGTNLSGYVQFFKQKAKIINERLKITVESTETLKETPNEIKSNEISDGTANDISDEALDKKSNDISDEKTNEISDNTPNYVMEIISAKENLMIVFNELDKEWRIKWDESLSTTSKGLICQAIIPDQYDLFYKSSEKLRQQKKDDLYETKLKTKCDKILQQRNQKILQQFFNCYIQWIGDNFHTKIKNVISKLGNEISDDAVAAITYAHMQYNKSVDDELPKLDYTQESWKDFKTKQIVNATKTLLRIYEKNIEKIETNHRQTMDTIWKQKKPKKDGWFVGGFKTIFGAEENRFYQGKKITQLSDREWKDYKVGLEKQAVSSKVRKIKSGREELVRNWGNKFENILAEYKHRVYKSDKSNSMINAVKVRKDITSEIENKYKELFTTESESLFKVFDEHQFKKKKTNLETLTIIKVIHTTKDMFKAEKYDVIYSIPKEIPPTYDMQFVSIDLPSLEDDMKINVMKNMKYEIPITHDLLCYHLMKNGDTVLAIRGDDDESKTSNTKIVASHGRSLSPSEQLLTIKRKKVTNIAFCESQNLFAVLFEDELAFAVLQEGSRVSFTHDKGCDLTGIAWWDENIKFEAMLIQEMDKNTYVWFIDDSDIVRAFDLDTNDWDTAKQFNLDQKYDHYILSPDGSFLVCLKPQYKEDKIYIPKQDDEKYEDDNDNDNEQNDDEQKSDIALETKTPTGRVQIHLFLLSETKKITYKITNESLTGYEKDDKVKLHNVTDNVLITQTFNCDQVDLKRLFIQTTQRKDAFLLCTISNDGKLLYHPLHIQVSDQKLKILKSKQRDVERKITKLDYMEYMIEKFGSRAAIYYPQNASLRLHTTYIMKDECKDDKDLCSQISKKICESLYAKEKKDFTFLKWSNNVLSYNVDIDAMNVIQAIKNKKGYLKGDVFIQNLIVQIPIQIARGTANKFKLMYNGEDNQTEYLKEGSVDSYGLAQKIRFGAYDGLIKSWSGANKKKVKVVTSMGKQSTGKSYMLNHLFGTKFDISGGRCTDGAWLSARIIEDTLFVLCDFEGLGSFERSPQEDMLLATFNAAVSNCTIFKCNNNFDRSIKEMFDKFQQGVKVMSGSEQCFMGQLMLVIKDVVDTGAAAAKEDFLNHIERLAQEAPLILNKKTNKKESTFFAAQMYKSGLRILPYPPLANEKFFERLNKKIEPVVQATKIVHTEGGSDFLNFIKLLMSKLNIGDFAAMSDERAKIRAQEIRDNLKNACEAGAVYQPKTIEYVTFKVDFMQNLLIMDGNEEIIITAKQVIDNMKNVKDVINEFTGFDKFISLQNVQNELKAMQNDENKYLNNTNLDVEEILKEIKKIQDEELDEKNDILIDLETATNKLKQLQNDKITQLENTMKELENLQMDKFKNINDGEKEYILIENKLIAMLDSLEDSGLILGKVDSLKYLYEQFGIKMKRNHNNNRQWTNLFQIYLDMVYWRRKLRVNKYIKDNTSQFEEFAKIQIEGLYQSAETRLNVIRDKMKICKSKCKDCFYQCLLCKNHEDDNEWSDKHTCYQASHSCKELCAYCLKKNKKLECGDKCGHSGKHNCRKENHTCGDLCSLAKYGECQKKCSEESGHDKKQIPCKCDAETHYCIADCIVSKCKDTCKHPYNAENHAHICRAVSCPYKCQVMKWDDNRKEIVICGRDCASDDHAHHLQKAVIGENVKIKAKYEEEQKYQSSMERLASVIKFDGNNDECIIVQYVDNNDTETLHLMKDDDRIIYYQRHICELEHPCPEKCNDDGNCSFHVTRKIVKHDTLIIGKGIEIEYDSYAEVNATKKRCCTWIPIGKFKHEGIHHRCYEGDSAQNIHTCEEKCENCGYFCQEKYGHREEGTPHDCVHGNMRNTVFYAAQEIVNTGSGRSYKVGDSGVAEMCNIFCDRLGRGHIHLELCQHFAKTNKKCTNIPKSGVRHQKQEYKPNPGKHKDEIKHTKFWRRKGWKDPCVGKNFDKCNFFCQHPSHKDTEEKTKDVDISKYCVEELWHKPCDTKSKHKFICKHPFSDAHVIFICDISGSMGANDSGTSLPQHKFIKDSGSLNNRLGALYSAIHKFLEIRLGKACKDQCSSIMTGKPDSVTGERSTLAAERKIADEDYVSKYLLSWKPGGGFDYLSAAKIVQKIINPKEDTLIIILTDGDDADNGAAPIYKKLKSEMGDKFKLFMITLGPNQSTENVNVKNICNSCRGIMTKALSGNELGTTFSRIAKQMNVGSFVTV